MLKRKIWMPIFCLVAFSTHSAVASGLNDKNWQGWRFSGAVAILGCDSEPELCNASPGGVLELATATPGFANGLAFSHLAALTGYKPQAFGKIIQGKPVSGTVITNESITFHAGDTLSFDWRFLTMEDKELHDADVANNDFAFIALYSGDKHPQDIELLADVKHLPEDCMSPRCGYHSVTSVRHFRHTFTRNGFATLSIGVVDMNDAGLAPSYLRVTHFILTASKMSPHD